MREQMPHELKQHQPALFGTNVSLLGQGSLRLGSQGHRVNVNHIARPRFDEAQLTRQEIEAL